MAEQIPEIKASIKGYRQLTQEEQDLINEIKTKAEEVGAIVARLEEAAGYQIRNLIDPDTRWLEKAKTDLQVGFMELVRSIAKPTTF